jgi:hypothetical protein
MDIHLSQVMGHYFQILWTGKGIGTGWGGFASNKWYFLLFGASEYWLGGRNGATIEGVLSDTTLLLSALAKIIVIVSLGYIFFKNTLRQSAPPVWRAASLMFGGTLAFGQVFNLYSQPQDPQMQINVMVWLPVCWGFIAKDVILLEHWHGVQRIGFLFLSLIGLPWCLIGETGFAQQRHFDSLGQAQVQGIRSHADLARTVFIFHGFEPMTTWLSAEIDHTYPFILEHSPQTKPLFKPFYLVVEATMHPERSPTESAAAVRDRIDEALAKGFHVIIDRVWDFSEDAFIDSFSTVSGADKPRAIFRLLKQRYIATKAFDLGNAWPFYELRSHVQGATP